MLERQKRDIEFALAELRRAYSDHYLRALGAGETAAGCDVPQPGCGTPCASRCFPRAPAAAIDGIHARLARFRRGQPA